jgi:hypothetical protein
MMLLVAIIAGHFFLFETHPDMQPWSTPAHLDNTSAETPLLPTAGATAHAAANLTAESYGTFATVDIQKHESWHVKADGRSLSISSAHAEKVFTKNVVMLIIALGIFTYHSVSPTLSRSYSLVSDFFDEMTYDHLLPIFLQDTRVDDEVDGLHASGESFSRMAGGLGLSTQQVGIIMGFNGIIALFIQALVFPLLAAWLGVWKLFISVTIGFPIAYFFVPFLTTLPETWVYAGIYSCLTIRNLFSIVAYPLILILIKEAAPSPHHLGKINGLAASTGAACRTIASPVAGLLYGIGLQLNFIPVAWWTSSLIAIVGAAQIAFITRQKKSTTLIHAAAPCRIMPSEDPSRTDVVHITVHDSEDEYDGDDVVV